MASFDKAYKVIWKNEGGYAANLGDGAGETYAGITRKNFPDWPGWKHVDAAKRAGKLKKGDHILSNGVPALVTGFYKQKFWDPIQGDAIAAQEIATFICDWFVNSGPSAFAYITRAAGVSAMSGLIGAITALTPGVVTVANRQPAPVYAALLKARKQHYADIVARDSSKRKFWNGWMARLASFPQMLSPVVITSPWPSWLHSVFKSFGL